MNGYDLKMHSPCVTPAIVLRTWPYSESDKIVSFLTEGYGKVTGIAKGAKRSRKRFVNVLEPFSLVNLHFHERPHSTLAFVYACDLIRVFKSLTASLEKIAQASYLIEITDALAGEGAENRLLFEHLKEGLTFIEENKTSLSFLTFFDLKLLRLSGYQPMLECCHRCGKKWQFGLEPKWCFSPRDGGIVCGGCATFRKEAVPLSVEALYVLADLQRANAIPASDRSIPLSVLKESRSALLRFIQFQINRELKSAPFLDGFSFA